MIAQPVSWGEPVQITVDTQVVLREDADRFLGINLNYIRDADSNRGGGTPLVTALQAMNVRWLRYPGGEKSDFYRWSLPPYEQPTPESLKWYAKNPGVRMDFDQYIDIARKLNAEPYVVVGYDSFQRTGVTKDEWITSAAAWVRYANRAKKHDVRYWEIGNENWNNGTANAAEMARIVVEFSKAMKAVDPDIQIGASGNTSGWWRSFLPVAAPAIDFVAMSLYNCEGWGNYSHFPKNLGSNTIAQATQTLEILRDFAKPEDAARIRLIVAETNSKDFSKSGWPGRNNLGHAIVLFDTLGRLMNHDRVRAALVWSTRWMKDDEASTSQWYALGRRNEILPTGRALEMWGRFIQPQMVRVSTTDGRLNAYACQSPDGRKVSVWVVNPATTDCVPVKISLGSPVQFHRVKVRQLSGRNPEDQQPAIQECPTPVLIGNTTISTTCSPLSVTVFTFE